MRQAASGSAVSVKVQGHASAEGTEAMNRVLSFLHAAEVKRVLVEMADKLRIERVSFETGGRGESKPAGAGNMPEARSRNRRVEVGVCQASS